MFLPHIYEPDTGFFRPILDGVKSSRFYQTLAQAQRSAEEQYADSSYFIKSISDHFTDRIRPVLTIIPDKHKMTYRSARECLIPRAFLMLNWMGNRYEKRSG
jgi:hypothetical protein